MSVTHRHTVGYECACDSPCERRVMKCVQERETQRQGQRVRLTKRECDSICSVSHEMVLVSLGRAKIYLCQCALHSPSLWHSKSRVLSRKLLQSNLHYSLWVLSVRSWIPLQHSRNSPQYETQPKSVWGKIKYSLYSTVQNIPFIKRLNKKNSFRRSTSKTQLSLPKWWGQNHGLANWITAELINSTLTKCVYLWHYKESLWLTGESSLSITKKRNKNEMI